MPIERERHEEILAELLKEDLEISKRTELLDELRNVNNNDIQVLTEKEEALKRLSKQKEDLVVSNSMLFRKLGIESEKEAGGDTLAQKSFSETITLEKLEKGL